MDLTEKDIDAFFSHSTLDQNKYLSCEYFFETTDTPRRAAATLCQEMSTAQWKRPGVSEDLRDKYAARIIDLKVLTQADKPLYSFPWSKVSSVSRCHITVAYPLVHFQDSIPNLLAALVGEGAFYAPHITTLRLLDVHFPSSFLEKFQGPQFGLEGLRHSLHVHDRPFFVGVVKPNLGLTPQDFASIAEQAWLGGLDMAKDDEMLGNPEYSPLKNRMLSCKQALKHVFKKTGRTPFLIANISDEMDRLKIRYNDAISSGANAVMINTFFVGFSAIRSIRKMSQVPIMGHFTGMALYDRIPHFGMEGRVLVKLQRLAGCDMIGLPGFGERMHTTDEMVLDNIRSCLAPMGPIKAALPIPGGSDSADTLSKLYQKIGHKDFALISGRGIFNHPEGPKAGAESLIQAWQTIVAEKTHDKK